MSGADLPSGDDEAWLRHCEGRRDSGGCCHQTCLSAIEWCGWAKCLPPKYAFRANALGTVRIDGFLERLPPCAVS